jgi:hypothetical protein
VRQAQGSDASGVPLQEGGVCPDFDTGVRRETTERGARHAAPP